ncbi:MAG: DinB family protein [Gemmatimonadetes bacterium]|nr:DinB family protein [Gemmatimonadota bacterium]
MAPVDLEEERRRHREAAASFLAAARAVPADRWNVPIRPGAWSPAQVAEHLRLSCQTLGGELEGRPGLRVRTSWWQRALLRFKFLGAILDHGKIPAGARAPRELVPGPGPFDRETVLADLEDAANRCEAAVAARWHDRTAGATHHVFGHLVPSQLIRFSSVHFVHHSAQIQTHG